MRTQGLWLGALVVALCAGPAGADLRAYMRQPDASFRWEQRSHAERPFGTVTDLHMTSQTWQGIRWDHRVVVFTPTVQRHPDTAVLVITGGSGGVEDHALGQALLAASGVTVAILFNIPNQPLFGMREDDLIAHTFMQYLETGDATWPLLFPMTKAAVRAMDALQAHSAREGQRRIERFIVTGASKRGWTSWLTAATGDRRVVGIVPIVYDNLNLMAQMSHQLASWGKFSEQIDDYTRRGLQQKMETHPRGRSLVAMVDPYTFREALTLPKLIMNGTNDAYWTQDALNLYWDGLRGPNWILYSPNSGHGMENRVPVMAAAGGFIRALAARTLPPRVSWRWEDGPDGGATLRVTATPAASSARLWTVTSQTKDFRQGRWVSAPMQREGDAWVARVARPASGFVAAFGETSHTLEGRWFPASTQIRIVGAR
ncbi:MAG TPA: PhoPQ-activated protein PqaA family protein [Chthonomonadales bacterium]|nr:PhoPQ-activated protein PqaA family protein [Chthonomonadales bacterium]